MKLRLALKIRSAGTARRLTTWSAHIARWDKHRKRFDRPGFDIRKPRDYRS